MVQRRAAAPASPVSGSAADGRTGRAVPPVQRDIGGTGGTGGAALPTGVPAKAVPARGRSRPASASSASGRDAARHAATPAPQDPGLDLDDLARRLIDPVARLLRTELRRGRERVGRPHDGRR
ncbi:hypothetical protein [Streptomyces poonensis]|uniref:hypothetical protein n=1 Tax=Streptomyces poonensis TaxID=68255 RepID=UPI0016746561|nr:hypothetical protein [Streptomyces poonensis]